MKNLGFRRPHAKNEYRPLPNDQRFERSSNPEDYFKGYYPRQMGQLEKVQWEKSVTPEDKAAFQQRQIRLGYKQGDIIR